MTSEQYTKVAEGTMTMAVDWLVAWAFEAMPPERVVVMWMDTMKRVAVRAVLQRIAEGDRRQ